MGPKEKIQVVKAAPIVYANGNTKTKSDFDIFDSDIDDDDDNKEDVLEEIENVKKESIDTKNLSLNGNDIVEYESIDEANDDHKNEEIVSDAENECDHEKEQLDEMKAFLIQHRLSDYIPIFIEKKIFSLDALVCLDDDALLTQVNMTK